MKKRVIIPAMVVAAALICSCGSEDKKSKTSSTSAQTGANKASDKVKKTEQEQQPEYVVGIDNSFESGLDLKDSHETLSPEESDFRNMKWGMSKEEVIKAQGTGYRETEKGALYYTRVREEDYPADAEYTFENDKLVMGVFYITQNKEDKPVTIDDYNELADMLSTRYGAPVLKEQYYSSEEDKTDDTAKQADLILNNKLQLRTAWGLNGTELRVVMFSKGGGLCIGLQYKNVDEAK